MLILVLGLQPETSQRWKQILLMVTVKMQVMLTFDSCRFPTAYQMATAYEGTMTRSEEAYRTVVVFYEVASDKGAGRFSGSI